ncbi:MAG: hypothetical protein KJ858_03275, partial [Nanoarchaeota archaeon]|nr:hypothetical protein [Nanoarchaeota archaeon]
LAKIKEGSGEFGIAFGARNTDGPVMDANGVSKIQYQVELISQGSDCVATTAASWFKDPIISGTSSGKISFLDAQGGSGYGIIFIEIPEGASECSQKVKISTYKTGGAWITSQSFRIEIISGGIFS